MALIGQVKEKLNKAMKENDAPVKGVLRVLLGNVQQSGKEDDETVVSAVKGLLKQVTQEMAARNGTVELSDGTVKTFAVTGQEEEIARLQREAAALQEFLPKYLSAEMIREILLRNVQDIKAAKNAGAATGVAMKLLKPYGPVDGSIVRAVVEGVYSE